MNSIVFLNYRAGSTLWQVLVRGGQDSVQMAPEIHKTAFYLPTEPARICPCVNGKFIEPRINEGATNNFCWFLHIGDWWGQCSGEKVPDPYSPTDCPTRWDARQLKQFGNQWRFAYLIRDGRNQISSFWHRKEETMEWKRRNKDPDDYFLFLCKSWRNRARVAIDCRKQLNNFEIFKFEELVEHPTSTLEGMISHLELIPDRNRIEESAAYSSQAARSNKHSSFGNRNFNTRWTEWTSRQREIFLSVTEREMIELGYPIEWVE